MNIQVENFYRLLPRGSIYYCMALGGPVLKKIANHGPGHFFIRNVSHGALGRILAGSGRVTGLLKGRNSVGLTISTLRYFFKPVFEVEKVNKDEIIFFLTRCPYGFHTKEDALLCDAVMQFERNLVHGIGGTLIIEETIPKGASKCKFTVKNNKSARPG